MKKRVFNRQNITTTLPVSFSITMWLLLDRLDASGWVWGVTGTIFGLLWISCIVSIFVEEPDSPLR